MTFYKKKWFLPHTDIEMHNLIKLDMVVLKPDYAFSGWSCMRARWKRIPKLEIGARTRQKYFG